MFVTLGLAGDTPQLVATNMTAFRRSIRKIISNWQDAYFVEPHRYRPGYHVHLFTQGVILDQTAVTDTALACGFPDTRNIKSEQVHSHSVYGYPLKGARKDGDQVAFREANRGRVVHATKGFWSGPDGIPINGGYESLVRQCRR